MNDEQLDKLFAAARQGTPDTSRAEYGFEARLMARLRQERAQPALWLAWAWRLMPVFAAAVVALGAWEFVAPAAETGGPYAALAAGPENQLLATGLTGE